MENKDFYIILTSSISAEKLARKVNEHIEKGYKILGDLKISTNNHLTIYCQAMILRDRF